MNVAIVDYGSGNLHSAHKAFERAAREAGLTCAIAVTPDPKIVAAADHIVLPGVGAFADCRRGLGEIPGMVPSLGARAVTKQGACDAPRQKAQEETRIESQRRDPWSAPRVENGARHTRNITQ